MFSFRTVIEEYAATLAPPEASRARGRAERKRYADGSDRLEVTARGLDVADGASVQVYVDNLLVAEAAVKRGRLNVRLDTDVPRIAAGHRLEVRTNARALLRGVFLAE